MRRARQRVHRMRRRPAMRQWQVRLQPGNVPNGLLRCDRRLCPLQRSGLIQVRRRGHDVRRLCQRAGVQQLRRLRVHHGVVPHRMLQPEHLRSSCQSKHRHLRFGRQRMRQMRNRASVLERRVHLWRHDVRRLLLQWHLRRLDQRPLRSWRRHLHHVPDDAGVQHARQMCLHAPVVPQRLLRWHRRLSDRRQQRMRGGWKRLHRVRRRAHLQRRTVRLQSAILSEWLLRRQRVRHDTRHVGLRHRRDAMQVVQTGPGL